MTDIDQILRELQNQYPKWLMDGLSRSPEVKNIEKSLLTMSKIQKVQLDANKGIGKSSANLKKGFDDTSKSAKELAGDFDDVSDSTKNLSKAHSALQKSLSGVGSVLKSSFTKELFRGNLSGAAADLTQGLRDAGTTLTGFAGKAAVGLGLAIDILSRSIEIIAKNNATYIKLAQSGFRIDDAFIGVSKAAINANLSLSDFAELATKNASVLAQWGPDSAKNLGALSYNIRKNSDLMGRFGFDIDEVNDTLTDYLQVQQRLGFLNKISQKQMNDGFKEFISDAAEFSNIIGYSRKDIIETATKLADAPQWGFFIKSLGTGGEAVNAAFLKASNTISAIEGPKLGGKIGDLMQDIISYGAPLNDQTRDLVMKLQATNPLLLKQIYAYSANIRAGKDAAANTEEMSKQLVNANSSFSEEAALRLQAAGQLGDFGDDMNEADSNIKNFQDRVNKAGGDFDSVIASMRNMDDENMRSAGTISLFNEALNSVKLALESGFISALDINKDNILKFSDTLRLTVIPKILEFTQTIKDFMSGDTREQMIQSISDVFRDVFHNLFPHWVEASHRATIAPKANTPPPPIAPPPAALSGIGSLAGMGNAVVAARKAQAMQYFISQGKTPAQAAGIVGNLLQEDPTLNPQQHQLGGGPGQGIAQWGPERQAAFKSIYKHNVDQGTLDEQLEFISKELSTTEGKANAALLQTTNPTDAAAAFMKFERPNAAQANLLNRQTQAVNLLGQYQSAGNIATVSTASSAANISNSSSGVSSITTDANGNVDFMGQQHLKALNDMNDKLTMVIGQNQESNDLSRKQIMTLQNNSSVN